MIKYELEFYNGAAWTYGGEYYDKRTALCHYHDYKKRYGKAKMYEVVTIVTSDKRIR